MIDGYDWAGGREAMLRFGPADGPVVVAAMPLLEEWNRTRAFVVTLLRALAERGVASVLPDLPGHGESLTALIYLGQLRSAMASVVERLGRPTVAVGVRSGSLLDAEASHLGRWYLSPTTGAELLRDLERVRLAGGMQTALLPSLTTCLESAEPFSSARVIRLATDPRPADRHVEGAPLWRRAEPGNDPALAAILADDIAGWITTCDA